jgi:hypothetical protein
MTGPGEEPHDNFELEPEPHPAPETEPAPEPVDDITIQPAEESAGPAPLEGPPASTKVDFENLPEFVWQRQMLRRVRNWALVISGIILLIVLCVVIVFGKKTEELLRPATEPLTKDALNPHDPKEEPDSDKNR